MIINKFYLIFNLRKLNYLIYKFYLKFLNKNHIEKIIIFNYTNNYFNILFKQ